MRQITSLASEHKANLLKEKRFLLGTVTGLFLVFTLFSAPLFSMNMSNFVQQASAQVELGIIDEEPTGEVVDEQPPTTEEQPPTTTEGQQQPLTTEEEAEDGQQPLSASLFVDTTNGGSAPATFLFELNVEGGTEPYTYSWDFGDGSPHGSGESLTHTYENPGTYTVILTVSDSAGQTVTDTEQVTVVPPSPLTSVEIFSNSTQGVAPATFEFAADIFREETRAFTFSWDFGDGQTATGEIVTHTYENPGTYTVTVTVAHPTTGQTVTDTEQVTVQPMTTTTPEGQQLATTNATELRRPPPIREMTIDSTVVVNALLSALVALSPPSSPLPTNDTLQEVEAICTDDGGANVTCPDVIMITRGGELLRCWDEEEGDDIIRRGSYTEVICPAGEIDIAKNKPQLGPPVGGPREMTID